ncbi:hypothetical protein GvMRE_I1g124 [endosymbiont GvMRE of Glomus versiforme]|nr:hypothetical protein GvMRE_I1g96 [endosymbiont GvMRE of Glomus versiforme]RHZ37356.1 hypothetical protein GvMRE_I1g124 [endosymbiont GvMRE of Glomus versiforme]
MLNVPFKFQQKSLKVSTIQSLNKKPELSLKVSVNRLYKNSKPGGQRK